MTPKIKSAQVKSKAAKTKPANNKRLTKPSAKTSSNRYSNTSVWAATTPEMKLPALEKNVSADVCIAGAGIAGLTIGYLLVLEGKSVIVLEKNSVGQGETINTSAQDEAATFELLSAQVKSRLLITS